MCLAFSSTRPRHGGAERGEGCGEKQTGFEVAGIEQQREGLGGTPQCVHAAGVLARGERHVQAEDGEHERGPPVEEAPAMRCAEDQEGAAVDARQDDGRHGDAEHEVEEPRAGRAHVWRVGARQQDAHADKENEPDQQHARAQRH